MQALAGASWGTLAATSRLGPSCLFCSCWASPASSVNMAPAISRIAAPDSQSATFPNEIFGLIGKTLNPFHEADRKTLRALTAVSRSLHRLMLSDAHHCIVLYGDSMAEVPFGVHSAFLQAPQHAHLLPVIAHLELRGVKGRRNCWDPLTYSELDISTFVHILRLLPHLQSFTLSGVHVRPSDDQSTQRALLPALSFPSSMTTFTSHHAIFTVEAVELLCRMLKGSSIQRLTLLQVEWYYAHPTLRGFIFPAAPPGVLQLHTPDNALLQYCGYVTNCSVIRVWGLESWDMWRVRWMLAKNKEVLERLDLGLVVKTDTDSAWQAFPP